MNRRHAMSCIGTSLLAACLPRRITSTQLPAGPITLGWRWVPGMSLTYRTVIQHTQDGRTTTRSEQWRYLVRALDLHDVATLQANLIGLGGSVDRPDDPVDAAQVEQARSRERGAGGQSTLRLGVDGSLHPTRNATGCHQIAAPRRACFGLQAAHRLLALKLPPGPVLPYDSWNDPTLMAGYSPLMPETEPQSTESTSRLLEVGRDEHGVFVVLESIGIARSSDAMSIRVTGRTRWNAARGVMRARTVQAHFAPQGPASAGRLTLNLTLV